MSLLSHWRKLIFQKLAQQQGAPATSTNSTTSTTPTNIPPTPDFRASSIFPGIRQGFSAGTVAAIDNLVSTLNVALQYSSNGTVNFRTLKDDNFVIDPSSAFNADQKNLMLLSQLVFHTFLNNGAAFQQALPPDQISRMCQSINQSPYLQSLSQVNPSSALAAKVGNVKDRVIQYLQYILNINGALKKG